jgi:hypothetical protein
MFQIKILLDKRRRGKTEPQQLIHRLNASGSEVLELRQVSRLVPNPFSGLRLFPILYEIKTRHMKRRGIWYVRTGDDGHPPDWRWNDGDGYDTSPVPSIGPAVKTHIEPISWLYDSIFIGGLILFGLSSTLYITLQIM